MPRPYKPWYHPKKKAWVIEPGGKVHVLVKGPKNGETERLAREELLLFQARRVEEQRASPPVDQGNPTVVSVVEAFLAHDEKHSAPRTFYERKRYLQLFAEMHGRLPVKDCKAYHLTSWLDAHPEWSNAWTHSYVVRSVKRPFNWAVEQDLIPKNPFAKVKHGPGDPRREMTEQEYQKLIQAAGKNRHLVEVLKFMRLTGCRPGEIRSVRWTNLDLERGVIVLRRHKTSRTQKDKKPRVIALLPEVLELLAGIRRRGDHHDFVFVTRLKKPWSRNGVQQNVRRLRRKIGLPEDTVVYGLRHHFGTQAILNNVELKTLSLLMGHEDTRITEKHYVHLEGQLDHLADAMRRANGLRPGG